MLEDRVKYGLVIRIVTTIVAGWLAYVSVSNALAEALADHSPAKAHAIAPGNARIAARLSEQLSGPNSPAADRQDAIALARSALLGDPTAQEAVATLGIQASVLGNVDDARRLFEYSERLSRRDLRTELWSIEDAVGRGDIAGALHHYDVALRTKPKASAVLYPVLIRALEDPPIRTALVDMLAARPLWGDNFITFAAGSSVDPNAVVAFLRQLRAKGVAVPMNVNGMAVDQLIVSGQFHEAWEYYAGLHPGASKNESRDAKFAGGNGSGSLFDWRTFNDSAKTTWIGQTGDGGSFDFSVLPETAGPLLQQLELLSPGRYVLDGQSTGLSQAAGSGPYWVLRCRRGSEVGRVEVPNSEQADGRFSGVLVVPEGCPVQILALIARPSSDVAGVEGQIVQAQLRPAR